MSGSEKSVVLLGYSGHAYVVADVLRRTNYHILGYLDLSEKQGANPFDLKFLGSERNPESLKLLSKRKVPFFPAIGDNLIRSRTASYLIEQGFKTVNAIHPSSIISQDVKLGIGNLICAGAIINPLARIGMGTIINTGSVIEHECEISNFTHIAPGAVLAGSVSVGTGSFVGGNSVVKEGVRIGSQVIIGAGSVVLNDIPNNEIWMGNPASKKSILS